MTKKRDPRGRYSTIITPESRPILRPCGWAVYELDNHQPLWVKLKLIHEDAMKQRRRWGVRRTRILYWGVEAGRFAMDRHYWALGVEEPALVVKLAEFCRRHFTVESVIERIGLRALEENRRRERERIAAKLARTKPSL